MAVISEPWSRIVNKIEEIQQYLMNFGCFSGWVQLHELIKTIVLLYIAIQFGGSSGLVSNITETRL